MKLNKQHAYKLLDTYPGMGKRDEVIWDSFIQAYPTAFHTCYYNVHIGNPTLGEKHHERLKRTGMYDVCQWCADVVAEGKDGIFVIEVKPDAKGGALGQALANRALLIAEGRIPKEARPMVVTDNIGEIAMEAAMRLGVVIMAP